MAVRVVSQGAEPRSNILLEQPLQIPGKREGGLIGKASTVVPLSPVYLRHFGLKGGSTSSVGTITGALCATPWHEVLCALSPLPLVRAL